MMKITGEIFGCYHFNGFHSYIIPLTFRKGEEPLHIHTQLQFISIPVCLWNFGLPWAMKAACGNSAAPPKLPHWEARLIIILVILCQTNNNSDYFVPKTRFLVLHCCGGSGPFHLSVDCRVLGWGGTNTTRAGRGPFFHLLPHLPLCPLWITTQDWSSFGPRPAPAR